MAKSPIGVSAVSAPPAGLLLRAQAFFIDYIFISLYMGALFGLAAWLNNTAPELQAAWFSAPGPAQRAGFVAITLPVTLYFTFMEASRGRGTIGKRRVRLRVGTATGGRLSWLHALVRNALKFLPWELAHVGVWHVTLVEAPASAWTYGFVGVLLLVTANVVSMATDPDARTLYDRIAGTVVRVGS